MGSARMRWLMFSKSICVLVLAVGSYSGMSGIQAGSLALGLYGTVVGTCLLFFSLSLFPLLAFCFSLACFSFSLGCWLGDDWAGGGTWNSIGGSATIVSSSLSGALGEGRSLPRTTT